MARVAIMVAAKEYKKWVFCSIGEGGSGDIDGVFVLYGGVLKSITLREFGVYPGSDVRNWTQIDSDKKACTFSCQRKNFEICGWLELDLSI